MRVIAGTARHLPLKTTEGMDTRPTTDRIKETLFNMLGPYLPGCRFLDLFAGSGAIGIEALSRGAEQAVFVENDERALSCIRQNLDFTRLGERARVIGCEATEAIRRLDRPGESPFDIIFMDPPYDMGWERRVAEVLTAGRLLKEDTLIIVEASLATDISWTKDMGLTVQKDKKYKTNKHIWIRKE
ncbi:MAG: 16S rRNA (guanine(966)-N(2))-methyltransferase RsmD [Lachnospiraceae bacterium]|jgi:16S rRNA (guanine966-N2)-methyltransferase|nr:16S rRNA (guanine(966)-N(2))-methyltransferase RsmD [Lachnospiraceae bacterium]